ncbi:MAG: DUF1844 domain-containing protein [Patescibacteria group bacterium]|nr:DUF1844 domain-containing protein [Patescibacteria group bacterium]
MANEDKLSQDERLFLTLVLNFQTSAWISMGKIKNPLTDSITRNLDESKFAIDVITMLSDKTRGNLSDNEQKFIQKALTELRLNYIDEVQKDKESAKNTESGESKEPIQSETGAPSSPDTTGTPSDKS